MKAFAPLPLRKALECTAGMNRESPIGEGFQNILDHTKGLAAGLAEVAGTKADFEMGM